MNKLNIGIKIRHIRELRNLTQENMASMLNISTRAYSKIETEETKLTVVRLQQICELLQVSISEIFGFEPHLVFNNSPNQQGGSYVAYNNTEIDQVRSLYEKLIVEKDKVIKLLESTSSNNKSSD